MEEDESNGDCADANSEDSEAIFEFFSPGTIFF